jgi:hypothetical protein
MAGGRGKGGATLHKSLPDSTAARGLTPHDEVVEEAVAVAGDGEPSTSAASAHAGIAARAGDAEGSGQREPRATTAWAGEQVRFRRLFVFSSATACALRSENGPFFLSGARATPPLPASCCALRAGGVRRPGPGSIGCAVRSRDVRARHATATPMRYL